MSIAQKLKILVREAVAFMIVVVVIGLACMSCTAPQTRIEEPVYKPSSKSQVVDGLMKLNQELDKLHSAVERLGR